MPRQPLLHLSEACLRLPPFGEEPAALDQPDGEEETEGMLRVVSEGLVFQLPHRRVLPSPLVKPGCEVTGIRQAERVIERAR